MAFSGFLFSFVVSFLGQYFTLLRQFLLFHNRNCQVYFRFRFRFQNLWRIHFFYFFFAVLWPICVVVVVIYFVFVVVFVVAKCDFLNLYFPWKNFDILFLLLSSIIPNCSFCICSFVFVTRFFYLLLINVNFKV